MLSGRGYYDAVMLHGFQLGPMISAGVIRPLDDMVGNPKLANPNLNTSDFIQQPFKTAAFANGKQYSFINWNYNQVYWARADLLNDPGEAGRLQGEVRLRPRPGQDHRADARHRRILHPQEGRDAGRQAAWRATSTASCWKASKAAPPSRRCGAI